MDNSLVITYDKHTYFFPYLDSESITICEPLKNRSLLNRCLFRIPVLSVFSYGFKKELDKADKIVIFDGAYNFWLGRYLKKKKENVNLYFWNPIDKMYSKDADKMIRMARKNCLLFSFDHSDCKKFDLKYKPMVYSHSVYNHWDESNIEYDLFFLGWKKDRHKQIENLYNNEFKGKYKCLFILVGDEERNIDGSIVYTKNKVSYSDYLHYVMKSKAILDIPQSNQEGLTIRNVESIFLHKKLVTTNENIFLYDFYNKNNIYILNGNQETLLSDFLKTDFVEVDKTVAKNYDFEYWIESF